MNTLRNSSPRDGEKADETNNRLYSGPPQSLLILWLFVAYFLTGYLGLSLPAVGTQITLIWLPTGISVAHFYRWGYRYWPVVFCASAVLNSVFGSPFLMALLIATGNSVAPLLAAWMLHQIPFQASMERWQDLVFLAFAAVLGMLVSATNGVLTISVLGQATGSYAAAWMCWWIGDSVGVIIAAPLVLVASKAEFLLFRQRRGEFAVWACLTFVVTSAVFVLNKNGPDPAFALAFVPLPLIAWATLRFGAMGTSIAIVLLSTVAVWGTANHAGMFYRTEPFEQILLLAAYIVISITLGWLISSLHFAQLRAISTQRILEEALREASMGVLLTDARRQITYANEGFTRLTGYSQQELLRKDLASLYDEHASLCESLPQMTTPGITGYTNDEFLHSRRDGTPYWSSMIVMPLAGSPGPQTGLLVIQTDVSERRRAQDELRASDARYRQLFHANPNPMWVYDLETLAFLDVNEAATLHYGYTRQEFLAMTIRDIRPPEDIPALLESVGQVPLGIEKAGTWRHRLRNGALIDVEITSHVVTFDDRQADLVLAHDVTEKKRAQEQASRELAMLEMIVQAAPLVDTLKQLVQIVEQMFSGMKCSLLLNHGEQDLQGLGISNLARPVREAVDAVLIRSQADSAKAASWTRQPTFTADIETDQRWADHRDMALNFGLRACWAVPMQSSHGDALGTLVVTDLESRSPTKTHALALERVAQFAVLAIERDELVRSLRDSRVQLETLIGNLPGMAYRCLNDPNWTMTFVSAGCEPVTGYTPMELENNTNQTYADLIHPDDRDWLWAKCQAALAAHTRCSNTYRIISRDGDLRWVKEQASGVYALDGTLYCIDGFIEDITEARRIEEHLRNSLREKVALLKEIHHRVKNNLQIITSLLSLQAANVTDHGTLSALRESQNRVRSMSLVHETLYQSENLGTIDLAEYLSVLGRHLFRSYGMDSSRVSFHLNVSQLALNLDQALPFGLIVNELVSNSLKYAFPEKRAGEIRIERCSQRDGYHSFVVSDDGIGFPKAFDYRQFKTLGLRLVHDLVQQLSGTLTVVESPQLEFQITFPIEASQQESQA